MRIPPRPSRLPRRLRRLSIPSLGVRGAYKTALLLALALIASAPAAAVPLVSFQCITNNNAGDCAIGESQLSGDLTGNVLTITMTGTASGVVKQIFIEGAGVTGISFDSNVGPGLVAFGAGAAGGNLPGGNQPSVDFMEAVNISAQGPAPRNGIGWHNQDQNSPQAGTFILSGYLSDLRVGVHVIGFDGNGSESFVALPIPEPNALLVFCLGGLIVGHQVRRQRR